MRGLLASWPLLCLSFILVCAVVLVSFPMLPVTAHVTGAGGRSRLGAGAGSRLGGRSTAEDTDGRMTHLILVAGHAVYTGKSLEHPEEEANWFLEDSQRGQLSTYLRHIEKGVELASKNPYAALMFSGGQTRSAAGPRSEGLSYWLAASAEGWWGHGDVAGRTVLEEYARDSLENLMFSLCRFREVHGQYPEFVTVVSYSYKQARFQDLHRDAVQFPPDRFHFVGVDPPINPFNDQGNIEKYALFLSRPSAKTCGTRLRPSQECTCCRSQQSRTWLAITEPVHPLLIDRARPKNTTSGNSMQL
ncbi:hypothetical protein DIPPA_27545 [Diplonema papillatum]|nr:hypothetical protein DIPPA_27545 [Diplonema papillatum]